MLVYCSVAVNSIALISLEICFCTSLGCLLFELRVDKVKLGFFVVAKEVVLLFKALILK